MGRRRKQVAQQVERRRPRRGLIAALGLLFGAGAAGLDLRDTVFGPARVGIKQCFDGLRIVVSQFFVCHHCRGVKDFARVKRHVAGAFFGVRRQPGVFDQLGGDDADVFERQMDAAMLGNAAVAVAQHVLLGKGPRPVLDLRERLRRIIRRARPATNQGPHILGLDHLLEIVAQREPGAGIAGKEVGHHLLRQVLQGIHAAVHIGEKPGDIGSSWDFGHSRDFGHRVLLYPVYSLTLPSPQFT